MRQQIELSNTIITFLNETKNGKYADVEKDIIETPRSTHSRDEYVFEEKKMPVFFSMSN